MASSFTLWLANELQRNPRELLGGHNQTRHNLPHRLSVVIPGNGKGQTHRPTHVVDASQLLTENISDRFNFNGRHRFHALDLNSLQAASLRTIALLLGALKP
jgi:hypothetical protein